MTPTGLSPDLQQSILRNFTRQLDPILRLNPTLAPAGPHFHLYLLNQFDSALSHLVMRAARLGLDDSLVDELVWQHARLLCRQAVFESRVRQQVRPRYARTPESQPSARRSRKRAIGEPGGMPQPITEARARRKP